MKETTADSSDSFHPINDCEVPDGWTLTTLHEVINDVQPGFACGKNNRERIGIPHIRPMNISEKGVIDLTDLKFVPESECTKPENFLEFGDVIFNNTNSPDLVGKTAYYNHPERRAFSNHMTRLRCNIDAIDPIFCAMILHQKWREGYFKSICNNHVSQSSVSRNVLLDTTLLLPPLAEQQRIVARVETLLANVNAARERLQRVPLIMKKFRQAVLAAACSGGLTEGWRVENPEVESSSSLFSKIQTKINTRYLDACEIAKKTGGKKPKDERKNKKSDKPVIDLPDLPESWSYHRLEDLSFLITDGTHITPEYLEEGIPFLSVKNIRPFLINTDNIKLISPDEHAAINQRCNPESQDILYTKVGSYGYAVQNKLDYPFSLFVSVALIKPVQEFFTSDYAEIVMNSPIVFEQAVDRVSGSGTPDLHLIEIRDFRIPLPPFAEQHEIVRRVEALFARADAVEREVAVATKRVDAVTQTVLAKAFSGRL